MIAAYLPSNMPSESKELLTYCIKRIRGLSKVKLVDASWVWTEPHRCVIKTMIVYCCLIGARLALLATIFTPSNYPFTCSMRLKVKLTIQGEVLNGAILQQVL